MVNACCFNCSNFRNTLKAKAFNFPLEVLTKYNREKDNYFVLKSDEELDLNNGNLKGIGSHRCVDA